MPKLWIGMSLLSSFVALGCASSPLRMTETGLQHSTYNYSVRFRDDGGFLPSDWRLDNFYGRDGKQPKTKGVYTSKVQFDVNGDGEAEQTESVPTFDLRFENLHSNGTISLRAVLLDQHEQSKDLSLLMADVVNSIAGGYDFRIKGSFVTGDVRLAARPVSEGPAKVAGLDAYWSIVDIHNVDQSLINVPAVMRRTKIVLVRSGLVHKVDIGHGEFPVYLIAQYAEHPRQFDRNLPAFTQLLGQIQVADSVGYQESAAPPAVPAEPPPAQNQQPSAPADSSETSAGAP